MIRHVCILVLHWIHLTRRSQCNILTVCFFMKLMKSWNSHDFSCSMVISVILNEIDMVVTLLHKLLQKWLPLGRRSWSWLRLVLRQLKRRLRWLLRKQTVQAVQVQAVQAVAEEYQLQLHQAHGGGSGSGSMRIVVARCCCISSCGIVEAQLAHPKIRRYTQSW